MVQRYVIYVTHFCTMQSDAPAAVTSQKSMHVQNFYAIARDFLRILTNIGSAACTSCKNRLQNLLPQVHAYRQSGGFVYSSRIGLTDSRHSIAIAQRRR